ncbi:MAG: hypothetical protein M3Y17_13210 [Actinomycetota bacterium]|nr:hypothetical protein [Actinomycetota bacterium]
MSVGATFLNATREARGRPRSRHHRQVYTSLYISKISQNPSHALPGAAIQAAKSSVGAGAAANHAPLAIWLELLDHVQTAFLAGLHAGCYVAAGVCALGVLGALVLPGAAPTNTQVAASPALG